MCCLVAVSCLRWTARFVMLGKAEKCDEKSGEKREKLNKSLNFIRFQQINVAYHCEG